MSNKFIEVFTAFLKLGLTSFGGPIAHIGYFREELVEKRKWVSEAQFAQLLAICQFLPGPASSQLGFSLGLLRAGWLGAVSAFVAFTGPSVLLLIIFASYLPYLETEVGAAAIHGLKLVALVVVGHGVLGMLKSLCPDVTRRTIAALGCVIILVVGSASIQIIVVLLGGFIGAFVCKEVNQLEGSSLNVGYSHKTGWIFMALFFFLLLCLPLIVTGQQGFLPIIDAFYRAGSLVFGGGHVVLPLLEEAVVAPGWVSQDEFLAGYGASQAIPGPMFSFASYLGMVQGGMLLAIIALLSIFLPGFLLVCGALPIWHSIASKPGAARVIAGINAAVVGLLGAALYDPIFITAVRQPVDLAIALVGFLMLATWRLSALWVVAWCVVASMASSFIF